MNERINESVNELIAVVEDDLCKRCGFLKLVNKMTTDVVGEFEFVRNLIGDVKCNYILESMAEVYAVDEELEAIKLLYYFMKSNGAKVSQYILKSIIEAGDFAAVYFLEALFKIEGYEDEVVYYDNEDDEEDFEPLENEGWI